MIVWDNHMHLRRRGRFLEAVKEFISEGGTHLVLCHLPQVSSVIQHKGYGPSYDDTLKIATLVRTLDVTVFVTVGPYPVDYIRLREKFGRDTALAIMRSGIDRAGELCEEGKCIGIGEIGRPHFEVDEEIRRDSNEILLYGMAVAASIDVPVVLHTESTTPGQCNELVTMGEKVGLEAKKIVKHFSPSLILPEENYGLFPSVLCTKKNVEESLKKGTRFVMETDYIDDIRRPGAVLGPKTVPRRTKMFLNSGIMTKEQAYRIHVQNPQEIYNLSLS